MPSIYSQPINPFGMSQNGQPFSSIAPSPSPSPIGGRDANSGMYGPYGASPRTPRSPLSPRAGVASPTNTSISNPVSYAGNATVSPGTLLGGAMNSNGTLAGGAAPFASPNWNGGASPINPGYGGRSRVPIGPGYQSQGSQPDPQTQARLNAQQRANEVYQDTSPFGARQQGYLAAKAQQAADNIRANPLAGQAPNQPATLQEDAARMMYYNMQQQAHGANIDQAFIDRMASQYNQDGAALLHSWATGGTLGQPVATYQPGQSASPLDLGALDKQGNLGPAGGATPAYGRFNDGRPHTVAMPNGDVIMVNDQGGRVGGVISHQSPMTADSGQWGPGVRPQPGVVAPFMPGYTPPSPTPAASPTFSPAPVSSINGWGAMAPGVAQTIANTPPGWTPQQAQEVTRLRNLQADNLDADAAARRATLPITDQQRFNAGVNVAEDAANAPVRAANAKVQGEQTIQNMKDDTTLTKDQNDNQTKSDDTKTRGLSDQEVARIRNEGRPASLGKQPESPQEKSLNDRYVAATARLRDATENYRSLLSTFTNPTDAQKQEIAQAKQERDTARSDAFDSQKMREDYYDSVSGPALNAAQPATTQPSGSPPPINGNGSPDPYAAQTPADVANPPMPDGGARNKDGSMILQGNRYTRAFHGGKWGWMPNNGG